MMSSFAAGPHLQSLALLAAFKTDALRIKPSQTVAAFQAQNAQMSGPVVFLPLDLC